MDPERLKAGRTIQIPLDPTNIQGKPVAEAPAATPQAPTPAAPSQDAAREYTVKSGDTLSGIAKAQYGSTRYKDLIFDANKDHLSSEDDVREGTKLRLPPKPK
jgi:nucleoid-associated protein YgaU